MNSSASAKRIVLVSLLGLVGLAVYKGNVSGDVGLAKRVWGVGALGLFLTVGADVAPTLAAPFALLVLVGYATDGGDQAIQNFLGKVSGSSSVPAPAPTTPAPVAPASASQPGTTTK